MLGEFVAAAEASECFVAILEGRCTFRAALGCHISFHAILQGLIPQILLLTFRQSVVRLHKESSICLVAGINARGQVNTAAHRVTCVVGSAAVRIYFARAGYARWSVLGN